MNDDLLLYQIEAGPMQNYVYLIGSKATREAVLVDPAWDIDGLLEAAAEADLEVTHALVTHYHPDHVGGSIFGMEIPGLARLLERQPVKVVVNRLEAEGLRKVTGLSENDLVKVDGGDTLTVGQQEIRFLHTPGHTPGSQCFLVADRLVSGDTLFIGGCGRVDLPGGDPEQLFDSLQGVLMKLPDETLLYPGHAYGGQSSTMGDEKRSNHYLRIKTREQWLQMMGR
jgi:glyoxylase-like metal-dependent hydrolase (beta-lactamase superfamily II)